MGKKMEYQFVKAKIIPKIVNTLKDNSIEVRKKSLIAIRKMLPVIDSQTIASHILTGL